MPIRAKFRLLSLTVFFNIDHSLPLQPQRRSNHRRELVQEMVTTEYEYIHDLEALIQVISLAPSQKESQMVDIKTLMGNISQVCSAVGYWNIYKS